jgi:2-polyprenyl-3-methyl-5-hydroxy-6-metoxy-1,4-benzoquinol methylase
MKNFKTIKKCLACDGKNLVPLLNLGMQPLANSYLKDKNAEQEVFPLKVKRCTDCFHVQLTVAVDPDLMYKDYLYVSGTSTTMSNYFEWFANFVYEYYRVLFGSKSFYTVLDIGCNDGSQLDKFKKNNIVTRGIDPAENLYPESSKKHDIICDYFNKKTAEALGISNIIVAQNVFAHNNNPVEFMQAAKKVMADDSLFVIQTSQANMILNNEFDTIYHEHISFYNIMSMKALCDRTGFKLIDAVKSPLHGSSYIFFVVKAQEHITKVTDRVHNIRNLIEMERFNHLYSEETYLEYTKKCNKVLRGLRKTINKYREDGYKIIGYGAAAKGMTLLNSAKVSLDYVIDDNKLKQNHFTPGTRIEIVDREILNTFSEDTKILFVPLAWNFFSEIKNKIKSTRDNANDKFLLYFPDIKVI